MLTAYYLPMTIRLWLALNHNQSAKNIKAHRLVSLIGLITFYVADTFKNQPVFADKVCILVMNWGCEKYDQN